VSSANVVVFIVGDPEQQGILLELQRVLHSVLSARIILNLRKFVVVNGDESRRDLTSVIFGELVSDNLSSMGYSTQRTQDTEEEGIELRDMRPPIDVILNINSGGEESHIP